MVVYVSLASGLVNVREESEFHQRLVVEGVEVYRFEFFGESVPTD